ncbi:porin [Pedobacter immunditicola]|uniref:porin n=1 Tax=Pedobacter immunditicola TaxID=3133440 RepID=UPI0030AC4CE9
MTNQKSSTSCCLIFIVTAVVFLRADVANAQNEPSSKLGKGIAYVAADSSFSIKFSPTIQVRYQGEDNPASGNWDDRIMIRRARLKFEGFAYSPRLKYELQLGFSDEETDSEALEDDSSANNILMDAVVQWNIISNLELWAGQTKLPGNRERMMSSSKMQFVDRSILDSQFNLDRDIGLQIHNQHQIGSVVVRETGSVSMGEGRNITIDNAGGYDYTARLEILPFGEFENGGDYAGSDIEREQTPKLALAGTFDYNDGASRAQGQTENFLSQQRDLRSFFVDAMFKYKAFSAMAEYANKKAPDGPVVLANRLGGVEETFITGNAFNVQAGYLFINNWEIAGRFTNFNPTTVTGLIDEKQYTFGVSKYMAGHNFKVQADATLNNFDNQPDNARFRVQLQVKL